MSEQIKRRAFLTGVAATACTAGALPTTGSAAEEQVSDEPAARNNTVTLEHLMPREIDAAMKACPTLFRVLPASVHESF